MLQKSIKELPNQPVIGRYRLLKFLQRGKNKSVYQAIDIHTAKPVVLKLLRLDQGQEDKLQRLQYFSKCMQEIIALDNPHIFPVLDFGKMASEQEQKHDYVFITMPVAAGRSLDIWLNTYWEKQKSLSTQLALQDIQQFVHRAAESLQYAHDKNVLHLGIKQTNFLIHHQTDEKHFPYLELADFSIARFNRIEQQLLSNQEASYSIAPELLEGQPTAASDQYAFAVMIYELLTNSPYVPEKQRSSNAPELFLPAMQTSRLTPAVNEILQRAISDVPDTRYPSVAEFSEAFEQAIRRGEPGKHIHMLLGVSRAEALVGVSYPLTMSDKQQITINVPPNAQAGQTLQIAQAGQPSPFGGPRGSLIVTLAIRPAPDENQQVVEQLQHLSNNVQRLQTQPSENHQQLQQQIETLDRKVTHIFNSYSEDEVKLQSPEDVPDYLHKHISPGLAIVLSVLMVIVIFGDCILSTTLKGAIVGNGNSNIQAINSANRQIAATASAYTRAQATATGIAQTRATAAQAKAVQNATDALSIPPQYHITTTDSTNVLFNDLVYTSNIGQWSQQDSANDQSCYFGTINNTDKNSFYHAQMNSKHNTPYFCQTSTAAGIISTGTTFVIQVQMSIINGDVGGIAFAIAGKSFCYFYIHQDGQYEVGVNNIPFSSVANQSNAIHKGTGPNVFNLLAVVVNNNALTFYANLQPIFSIRGIQVAQAGKVAVVARSDGSPTNVTYQKIKIWRY